MEKENSISEGISCPLPLVHDEIIVLGHGSGGRMSHNLIRDIFYPAFDNKILREANDSGVIHSHALNIHSFEQSNFSIAVSTDSHVVSPLFFPGGDIGRLAVCGTVNDVSMMGAIPMYITASFILEEGLNLAILKEIVDSMRLAAVEANVEIIAGDTKVVQKNKADGMYINTTGIGFISPDIQISGSKAKPGDRVIISGTIGDHGIAVLQARNELEFDSEIQSDIAPLNQMVRNLVESCVGIHVLRDPTRGGLATSLIEIAIQSGICIEIEEDKIPIAPPVCAACEMLGFDPMYIANEGKLIAIVDPECEEKALMAMRNSRYGINARSIGTVIDTPKNRVLLKTNLGTRRVLDMLSGELLPRIC